MSKITFESVMEEIRASLGEARLKQIAEVEEPGMIDRVKNTVLGARNAVRKAVQTSRDERNAAGPTPAEPTNSTQAPTPAPAATPPPSPGANVKTAKGPAPVVSGTATPADRQAFRDRTGSTVGAADKGTVSGTATPADRQAFRDRTGSTVGAATSKPSAPAATNVRAPVPTAPAASTVKAPSSADEYSRSRNSGSDEIGGSAADLIRGDRAAAAERAAASKPMQENFEQFVLNRAKGKSS